MAGTGIMAGIYSSPSPSPYPIKKIGDSPYPYPYPVNAEIPLQNGDGFGQYPRGRVYLPSLIKTHQPIALRFWVESDVISLGSGLIGVVSPQYTPYLKTQHFYLIRPLIIYTLVFVWTLSFNGISNCF